MTNSSGANGRERRLALVTETFAPAINGVANSHHYLCTGLLERGHQVSVVRPRLAPDFRSQIPDAFRQSGAYLEITVPGIALPHCRKLTLGLPNGRLLRRLWQETPPDAVYLATQGPLGWFAQTVAGELGIPTCADYRTNFQSYSRQYGAGFMEQLISGYFRTFHNRAGLTLVPTRRLQSQVEALGVERTTVWGRGVDCDRFSPDRCSPELRQSWGLEKDDLGVVYVGRLAADKNLMQAVATFERVRSIHPRARFILAGDGPLRERLQQRHRDYVFCGTVQGEELARHFASGDLLLFPSKADTFGNVVLEAMASGLAVVAFDNGAAGEHIEDCISGMTIPLDDNEAFTRAALRLTNQPSLRRRVSKGARAKALTLDWRLLTEQFEHLVLHPLTEVHRHAAEQSIPLL